MPRKSNVKSPTFLRAAGIGAIGFASVLLIGNAFLVQAGLPTPGSGVGEAEAFFGERQPVIGATSLVSPLAWVLATLFAAGAASVLWPSDRDRGEAWSLVGLAGVVMQNAVFTGVIAVRLTLASTSTTDEPVIGALWVLQDALIALNGTFLAAALLGFSISGIRAGLLHRWHARAGLIAAALQFTGASIAPYVLEQSGQLSLIGLAGWLIWAGWLIAYGVTLIRLGNSATRTRPTLDM